MATYISLVVLFLCSLFHLSSAQLCTPGSPLVSNPTNTVKGTIKLYLTTGAKGAKRYPINQSFDIPSFGFFMPLLVQKPGKPALGVQLSNSQLNNGAGAVLAHRAPMKGDGDLEMYFAADDRAITQVSHAVDICNAAGEMVQVLAVVGPLSNLVYRPFVVKGPVGPGATIYEPGASGGTKVDIEIHKA